jgi:hypothetical protein
VPDAATIAYQYATSWMRCDRAAAREAIAPDAEIEWNLGLPVDDEELVQTQHRIAAFADRITIASSVYAGDRAAFVYDCAAPFGTVRLAEFLTVDDAGLITEIRQTWDVTALRWFVPGILDELT